MNNRIYTTGEIRTIRTNLREIEERLGHPIPGGLIDVDDLKDHVLRTGEVVTITNNLRRVCDTKGRIRRYTSDPIGEALALILIGLLSLPLLGIIELIEWISNAF